MSKARLLVCSDDSPPQKLVPWSEVLSIALLPGVLGGLLVFDLMLAFLLENAHGHQGSMILGAVMGQMTLAAVFSSLAPIRYFPREAYGLFAVALITLPLAAYSIRNGATIDEPLTACGFVLVIWLVLRIPIAIVRRCFGWRLALAGDETTGVDEQHRRQFSLKYLFLCTALTAVVFGIARMLFTSVSTFNPSSGTELLKEIAGCLILIIFNGLGGAVVIAGTLTPKKTVWRLAAAFVGCVLITGMEVLVIQWMATGGDYEELLWFNGIQFAIVALVLLTLRGCGVALVRVVGR